MGLKINYSNERRNKMQHFPPTDISVIPRFGKFSFLLLKMFSHYSFLKRIHFKSQNKM
jgi:hypothetical protein